MNLSPIAIFAYSRKEHTKRLVDSLLKNDLFLKSKIYFFLDAAKDKNVEKNVLEVKKFIKDHPSAKKFKIVEREMNYGLSKNIIEGLNEVFLNHEKVIVLEDDLELSPYFLNFMNDALNIYSEKNKVASISGYMYLINSQKFSDNYFFLKLIESWGWGTWKRAWKEMRLDSTNLRNEILFANRQKEFSLNNKFNYFKMLEDNISKKNDSWAVKWYASIFLKDMLTLFPNKSFVHNTGLDSSGEHCGTTSVYDSKINHFYDKIDEKEPLEINNDRKILENYFYYSRYKFYYEILKSKIKKILNF